MKTIQNPTDKQLQRLMNLIALPGVMDEEAIGDRFYFNDKNGRDFIKDFINWLEKKYPSIYSAISEDEDADPNDLENVVYGFWPQPSGFNGWRPGYKAFKACAEYIYSHDSALQGVCKELEDFSNDSSYLSEKSHKWGFILPFNSENDYRNELATLFNDVQYGSNSSSNSNNNQQSSDNLYFLDSIHEDGQGGADLSILPANMTGDFEEDFKDVPFIHIDSMSELNGVEEGDYFLYDEATNTITPANNHPVAKQIIDDGNRLRQELIDMSNVRTAPAKKNSGTVQTINSWVAEVQPGRKAKVMSKMTFIDMLIDDVYQYLCPEEQQWVEIYQDGGRPGPVVKKVSDNMYEQYPQPKFYEAFIAGLNDKKNKRFALIRKDVSKLADPITSFSEAYHLKKGLGTVHNGSIWFVGIGLWTDINMDGEAGRGSATAFAYYDGKDWRAFVPTRGNTINAKTKHIILYSRHSNKYSSTEGIVRPEDYEYLTAHNYNLDMIGEINDPDTDMMLASLEVRLVDA